MSEQFQIHPFDVKKAGEKEFAAFNRHINLIRRERLPDDPAIPLEETIQTLRSNPPFVDVPMWCAWDPGHTEMIAEGEVELMRTEENRHLAYFRISVLPAYRRKGLGRRLLAFTTEAARADGRKFLTAATSDRVPAGEAFLTRIGARKGQEAHVNQLCLADLDRRLLERWLAKGQERSQEFELGFWEGPYPEDQLPEAVRLHELGNQQPRGELAIEDSHVTPEQLRQSEQSMQACGLQRWTCYVVERATGTYAGFTEVGWSHNRPEILIQFMTGVFPEYRNRGLGRWLKAAMLAKVLRELPAVKVVRTGNADANAPMLKINTELGFQPYLATALWQVEVDQILKYLAGEERV